MMRLAKIALILVAAALVMAAGRGLPLDTRNLAAPAGALSVSPGDMMRYTGPLPELQRGSLY